jgi:uncharacterized protein (TIGR03083 family)
MDDIRKMIEAERGALAGVLTALPAARWDEPTLCARWRVREVVAHITMPFRYSMPRFLLELARSGGRFGLLSDRIATRDARQLSSDQLVRVLQDNLAHPWKPPGGGFAGALTHDVIHGMDITVPLGLDRPVPAGTMDLVLENLATPKGMKYFGVDLSGVCLEATDIDWHYGSGAPVTGTAQSLALLLSGRKLPAGHLSGSLSERFTGTGG